VTLTDGTSYAAEVVAADTLSDLAVLRIINGAGRKFPCIELASSDQLVPGEMVVAIGSPLTLTNSCTFGVVSNVNREDTELGIHSRMSYIQTDAPITLGNSGGPLVNLDGKVVGVSSMTSGIAPNIGFAIPIDRAKEIIEDLNTHGKVQRPYVGLGMLGIGSQALGDLSRRGQVPLPPGIDHGVLIIEVQHDSPAEHAGLKEKMIIIEVNGKPVSKPNDVIKNLGKPGKPTTIKAIVPADPPARKQRTADKHQVVVLQVVPQVAV